jgi:hypothetical protein
MRCGVLRASFLRTGTSKEKQESARVTLARIRLELEESTSANEE